MRLFHRIALVAAVGAIAACSGDTVTSPSPDALQAADQLSRLADSISVSDNATAETIRGLADVVRQSGTLSTVSIAIDGESHDFSAVSNETIVMAQCLTTASTDGSPTTPCVPVPVRTRSLVAWQPGTKRIVVLTALAESGPIGGPLDATRLTVPAMLQLFSGEGGIWWGISGEQSNSMSLGKECPSVTVKSGDRQATRTCHEADFRWKYKAVVDVPPVAIRSNTATRQHTVEMAESSVHGAQWIISITLPPPPKPPTTPPPASPLVATLRVGVDSVVHLAFTVTNATDARIELKFPSAKTHDFAIADKSGTVLWRWSDGKSFGDVATVIAIAPHESIKFTEQWRPTTHGELIAGAVLTSATQNVSTRTAFTVP